MARSAPPHRPVRSKTNPTNHAKPSDSGDPNAASVRLVVVDGGEPDDLALLQRWVAGDRRAGDRLVRRYYLEVTRFFMNAVGDQERRDLTNETFKRLCTAIDRFQRSASFRSFLYGIARNVLNEFLRKRYRQREHEGEFDPQKSTIEDAGQTTPSRLISALVRREGMVQCLRELPVDDKQLLELYYWHGMTAKEVGKVFGIPEETVRTRAFHIRRRLAANIAEREPSIGTINVEQQLESLRRLLGFGPRQIDDGAEDEGEG